MKIKVNFRIDKETDKKLEIMAAGTRRTKSAVIEMLTDLLWPRFETKGILEPEAASKDADCADEKK